jgi:TonB family protein
VIKPGGLGRVTLYLVIGTDGRPANVAVLRSSMPSALAAEVVRAVSQWRYYPATKDGERVTVMSTVHFTVNMWAPAIAGHDPLLFAEEFGE